LNRAGDESVPTISFFSGEVTSLGASPAFEDAGSDGPSTGVTSASGRTATELAGAAFLLMTPHRTKARSSCFKTASSREMEAAARLDAGMSRNVKRTSLLDGRVSRKDGRAAFEDTRVARNVEGVAFLDTGLSRKDGRAPRSVESVAFLDGGVSLRDACPS
jgi:hypothetical protein